MTPRLLLRCIHILLLFFYAMEVSYIDINECCRCCMNFRGNEDLDNIFECFYKNFELQEILSLITGLSIGLDDGKAFFNVGMHPLMSSF